MDSEFLLELFHHVIFCLFFTFGKCPIFHLFPVFHCLTKKKPHQKLTVGQSTAQSCLYYLNIYDILATCSSTLIREKNNILMKKTEE